MAASSSSPHRTSLLTATDCRSHVHLIIGSNPLAGKRCEQSLATGAKPILVTPDPGSPPSPTTAAQPPNNTTTATTTRPLHYGLAKLVEAGQVQWRRQAFAEDLLFTLGREEVGRVVDAVFVTTFGSSSTAPTNSSSSSSPSPTTAAATAEAISALCKRNRIPVNVVDRPDLCTFSILSTHTDGPLQVGITTNGRGCHLAGRIRREVAAALPGGLGAACARLGEVRRRIQVEDQQQHQQLHHRHELEVGEGEEGMEEQAASFNKLVTEEDLDAAKTRRMRWLAQVCEYWPLKRLAAISDEDVETVLKSYPGMNGSTTSDDDGGNPNKNNNPNNNLPNASTIGRGDDGGGNTSSSSNTSPPHNHRRGRIILAGSGPGHPDLLTRATHKAILAADLVLADKLVPSGVLDLVPRRTPVTIARKFPGNADRAQEELLAQALAGVRAGLVVLRLKQGDPFVYGRGGEEVAYFRARGLGDRVVVLPGVTSALSAPLFAGVPPTQRDVADQVLVCTGTGKKGRAPAPPEYVPSRTCVFLMALHRIEGLVGELTAYTAEELGQTTTASPPPTTTTTTEPIVDQQPPSQQQIPNHDHQQQHTSTLLPAPTPTNTPPTNTNNNNNIPPPPPTPPTRALWPPSTPCAVIERASCPDQRVIRTTLASVAEAIAQEGSRPPGLLVVGRACEALYSPPSPSPSSAWVVEDGFKGFLDDDGGGDYGSGEVATAEVMKALA